MKFNPEIRVGLIQKDAGITNRNDFLMLEKYMNKAKRTYHFPYTLYICVFPVSHFIRTMQIGTSGIPATTDTVSGGYYPSCSGFYNTWWFVGLWMLIWIVTIALVVTGCRLYYRYKEAKERMKRKEEEERELEEINNLIKQQK